MKKVRVEYTLNGKTDSVIFESATEALNCVRILTTSVNPEDIKITTLE